MVAESVESRWSSLAVSISLAPTRRKSRWTSRHSRDYVVRQELWVDELEALLLFDDVQELIDVDQRGRNSVENSFLLLELLEDLALLLHDVLRLLLRRRLLQHVPAICERMLGGRGRAISRKRETGLIEMEVIE